MESLSDRQSAQETTLLEASEGCCASVTTSAATEQSRAGLDHPLLGIIYTPLTSPSARDREDEAVGDVVDEPGGIAARINRSRDVAVCVVFVFGRECEARGSR